MNIHFIEPLSKGISRTKNALFKPFDIGKWFTIGFAAFLAGLTNAGFPGSPGGNIQWHKTRFEWEDVFSFPQKAWEWLMNHPVWAVLIAIGVVLVFVFGIVLTWLSSRGKFMFLDNVIHDRSKVVAPWHEYRNEGNSLFLFNFIWGILSFGISIAYFVFCFMSIKGIYDRNGHAAMLILPVVLAVLGLVAIGIINLFFIVLLKDFVVPIMYRDRITTTNAIRKFLPLLLSHPFYFIGYELFLLCITILIGIGIIIAGCVTCCIGFIILAIPYIGVVVLLPISYTLRTYSIEFLEQFGPDFYIFPRPEAAPPEAQPVTE